MHEVAVHGVAVKKVSQALILFFLLTSPTLAAPENPDAPVFSVGAGWLGETGPGAFASIEGFFPGVGFELRGGLCGTEALLYAGSEFYPSVSARLAVGGAYRWQTDCLGLTTAPTTGWALLGRAGLEYQLFFAPSVFVFVEYGFVSYWVKNGTVGSLSAGLRYQF